MKLKKRKQMTKKMTKDITQKIAKLNLFPPAIQSDILLDPDFLKGNSLTTDAVVTLKGNAANFQRSILFETIRKAYLKIDESITVVGKDGNEWKLHIDIIKDAKRVCIDNGEQKYYLNNLWPLNPDIKERLEVFEKFAKKCNFSSSAKKQWRDTLSAKLISDDDISNISKEIAESPISMFNQLKAEICSGFSHISTFVPNNERYYERLVGKYQNSLNIFEYSRQEIGEHINTLFSSDYHSALLFFFLMAAHPSITLGLENFGIQLLELEKTYDWLIDFGDPVSCVAGMELGISILHKYPSIESRIEKLASKLINETTKNECRLLASLIKLVDGELARLKTFKDKPAFYRRLASMAQASMIMRCVIEAHVVFDNLIDWTDNKRSLEFYCQSFIDLRSEPRWTPDYLTPEQMRAELLGRVFNVSQQYAASITSESLKKLLLSDEEGSFLKIMGFNAFLPGPLEGNAKPNDPPAEISSIIENKLKGSAPSPESFAALLNSAQYWKVEPQFTELALKILNDAQHQLSQSKDHDYVLATLNGLARVASIVKSEDLTLSLVILAKKYRGYLNVNSKPEDLLIIGLISAASFNELEKWAEYIGNWLNELSYLQLEPDAARRLYRWVKQLCIFEPLLYCSAGLALANLEALIS
jgi:hypothetical protein